ncbi:PadR family transcriptional regulator [Acetanaerobacterium elongatum]|uniref:Transcriptional regulator, PadR family n=1 Tax=Acetanaerobacterium elongatum TaxID=258515 RepID=A0A1G9WXI5_9FIRM|nr:PadR family transcriptional regulator [Acetanaerobacterium elongatum]SDM88991.1 transcriptional regulator, PadR family [Acetanaerobacterium elongatum]
MNVQYKKGVLELCVLSLLKQGDKYGYELAESISKEIPVAEGTIYPILRRLKDDGQFEVYIKDSSEGPPRKYYRLTSKGLATQEEQYKEWSVFTKQVIKVIGGLDNDEK